MTYFLKEEIRLSRTLRCVCVSVCLMSDLAVWWPWSLVSTLRIP